MKCRLHPHDPHRHNYFAKVMALTATVERGKVYVVTVAHDDWCAIYGGGYCNCDPDVTARPFGATDD